MQTLTVEIMAADALGESEWTLWREMVAANPDLTSPYFRPRFTRVAARVSPGAAVAVLHRGGDAGEARPEIGGGQVRIGGDHLAPESPFRLAEGLGRHDLDRQGLHAGLLSHGRTLTLSRCRTV